MATLEPSRLLRPLYRSDLNKEFEEVSWEQALGTLTRHIERCIQTGGPDSIAMYGSGQLHSEDYFLAQKLLKGAIGTNNFDANSRLCMSSAVAGYYRSFGSDGPPCCYEDLERADLVVVIGSNMDACHPVLFDRLMARKARVGEDVQVVVVDPRRTATAQKADLHLPIAPGTDLFLLCGLANALIASGDVDEPFIRSHTQGFEGFRQDVHAHTLASSAERCRVPLSSLRRLVELWRSRKRVVTVWSMGVNQRVEGTATVGGIINLHLLTGQLGRPGAGPFSLTGQPNAMGGRESGGLSHLLPGYRLVTNTHDREFMEQLWGFEPGSISSKPGLTAIDQVRALENGELDLVWILATNPLVSMPNLNRSRAALGRCPMVVVQEAYSDSETLSLAHMVLPAAQWTERDGVMTNSERRITLCPKFRAPPGESRPDWEILAEVGRRLGYVRQFTYAAASEVFDELVTATAGRVCDYSGLSHHLLREHGPQQWPFPTGATPTSDSKRLYSDRRFPTPDGRARFVRTSARGLAEPTCDEFPLVLTTGRVPDQWHTMTRTGRLPELLRRDPSPFLEVHPADAARAGLVDGVMARIASRRGELVVRVRVTERSPVGLVFLPMHWGASQAEPVEVNHLTHELMCPTSKQPELKACAVKIWPAEATT